MREKLRLGFDIPYMITGHLNQHPRSAMKFMADDSDRKNIVDFFDSIMEEE